MNNIARSKSDLPSLLAEADACIKQNKINEAMNLYRVALSIAPEIPQLHNNLGSLLRELGMVEYSIKCFRQALKLKSDYSSAHSNLLFVLQSIPDQTLDDLYSEHKLWATLQLGEIKPKSKKYIDYKIDGPVVIGLVSPDFYFHPVSIFLFPWLLKHDRGNFKIIAYSDRTQEDAMSIRIKNNVDAWKNVVNKTDDELAYLIERDKVDVLFDLAGHTAGNRLKMFARRLARLQISWIGYSATTGVPNMDMVIMDDYIAPKGCERFFTEKLVRLDTLRFCYTPPAYAPAVAPPPFLKNGYLTFGCFNNLSKITSQVIQTWASILNAVPDSRLILKWKSLGDKEVSHRIELNFQEFGVSHTRIECRGWSQHKAMLAEYSDIDVALDPFPFSGGLTSCDALYMGIPIVTLPGDLPISRQTGSFLKIIGLSQLIASDRESYIALAIKLARNKYELRELRSSIRNLILQSALCDADAYARSIEKVIKENLLSIEEGSDSTEF